MKLIWIIIVFYLYETANDPISI